MPWERGDERAILIGVAGGSGSGKSTFVARLAEVLGPDRCGVLSLDSYYLDQSGRSPEERAQTDYDAPSAVDFPLLNAHLRELRSHRPVRLPVYDFRLHVRREESILFPPRPVLLLEGVLLFADPGIRGELDFGIYVDADADLRLVRRIHRDVEERGRTLDSVTSQYLGTVKPGHDRWVAPGKAWAHLIVPGDRDFGPVVDLLARGLRGVAPAPPTHSPGRGSREPQ